MPLHRYFTKQHSEHQNKSKEFFQSHLAAQKKQSKFFDKQMGLQSIRGKNLLLASLKMSHHTSIQELECVVLPCVEIAADLIHGGEKEVNKIKQIPLSDTTVAQISDATVARQCAAISTDIKEQLIQKILKASSFGIQLDESTDITSKAQLMVFCRFPDIETNRIVEHYLFCQPIGVRATSETIFQKLNEFFEKERLD